MSALRVCWVVQGPPEVCSGAEDVDVASGYLHCEEHVDPFQGDGAVDVEGTASQHACGLSMREPPPGSVGVPGRRGRYPQTQELAGAAVCWLGDFGRRSGGRRFG